MKKKAVRHKHPGRRGRQTAKSMLIRGFLQSFFIVAILLIAGTIGYQTTMKLWMIPEKEPVTQVQPEPTPEPITVPSVDEVSRNLIFCYDAETKVISKILLEVFHCERKQLTYITIPTETQFTMSDILYRQLIAVEPSIPQMLRLSAMTRYLDSSVIFDYGELMVEDMLGLEISYYTVVPVELFQTIFEEKSISDGISAADIMEGSYDISAKQAGESSAEQNKQASSPTETEQQNNPVIAQVFTRDYVRTIDKLDNTEQISTYIEELYPPLQSNLPVSQKMNYLDSYSKTSLEEVSFTRLAGFDKNSGFVMDPKLVQEQLRELGVFDK